MTHPIDREAVLAALEAFLHTPPKEGWSRDTLDKLDAMAEYSNGTVNRAMAAVRSLPPWQPTDEQVERACSILRKQLPRSKEQMRLLARTILAAAIREGGKP